MCLACVAAGVLQQVTAARGRFSVIKLVLTLYILITAFGPVTQLREGVHLPQPAARPAQAGIDVETLAVQDASRRLEKSVADTLRANGIAPVRVTAALERRSGGAELTQIDVVLAPQSVQKETVDALVREALGAPVRVVVEQEGQDHAE